MKGALASGALRVPFGLRDGRMWRPQEVAGGLACGCSCPGCRKPLVARNGGTLVRPHFAHDAGHACVHGLETAVHLMAKQILQSVSTLTLPEWRGALDMPNPPVMRDREGTKHVGDRVDIPSVRVALHEVRIEQAVADYRPDVLAVDDTGELLIEIRVHHKVDDLKRRKVQSDGRRMIEIDLSSLRLADIEDADAFERAVLHDHRNRLWLSNPAAAEAWRASRERLARRVAAYERTLQAPVRERPIGEPLAVPMGRASARPQLTSPLHSAEPGQRLWHSGLGEGRIVQRIPGATPLFVVEFPPGKVRTIVLEDAGRERTWRLLPDASGDECC